jgi:hypothetical protein
MLELSCEFCNIFGCWLITRSAAVRALSVHDALLTEAPAAARPLRYGRCDKRRHLETNKRQRGDSTTELQADGLVAVHAAAVAALLLVRMLGLLGLVHQPLHALERGLPLAQRVRLGRRHRKR